MMTFSSTSIHITIRAGEPLRRALPRHRIALELPAGATINDLLSRLSERYPEFAARFAGKDLGRDHPYRVFVNHKEVPADAFANHALADGDVVHIVIPIAGGA